MEKILEIYLEKIADGLDLFQRKATLSFILLKGEVFFQSHLWILPLLQIVTAGGNFDVSVSLVSLYECPPCYSDQHPIQKIGRKGDI